MLGWAGSTKSGLIPFVKTGEAHRPERGCEEHKTGVRIHGPAEKGTGAWPWLIVLDEEAGRRLLTLARATSHPYARPSLLAHDLEALWTHQIADFQRRRALRILVPPELCAKGSTGSYLAWKPCQVFCLNPHRNLPRGLRRDREPYQPEVCGSTRSHEPLLFQ